MEAICKTNYIRISHRKMSLVVNEVRGYDATEALDALKHMKKKGAKMVYKAVQSAVANARVLNPSVEIGSLFIKKVVVNQGATWKRFRPRARGRVGKILRRTSNIIVVLSDE